MRWEVTVKNIEMCSTITTQSDSKKKTESISGLKFLILRPIRGWIWLAIGEASMVLLRSAFRESTVRVRKLCWQAGFHDQPPQDGVLGAPSWVDRWSQIRWFWDQLRLQIDVSLSRPGLSVTAWKFHYHTGTPYNFNAVWTVSCN